MADGVQEAAPTDGIVENIAGTQSFVGSTPQVDPMVKASEKPPEGVPAKFWDADKGALNTDALLKSYAELEKKFSAPKEETEEVSSASEEETSEESTEETVEETTEETAEETTEASEETTEETEEETTEETQTVPLADAITTAQTYFQTHGDLPADARKDLHALGISDEVIDLQISGARAYTAALEKAATTAAGVDDYAEVTKAIEWAATNWTPKKIAAFNAQAGDIETVPLAVTALFKDYRAANPGEGRMISVNPRVNQGDVYESRAEFQRDLAKADKERDQIARKKIIAKFDRSLKAGSVK